MIAVNTTTHDTTKDASDTGTAADMKLCREFSVYAEPDHFCCSLLVKLAL